MSDPLSLVTIHPPSPARTTPLSTIPSLSVAHPRSHHHHCTHRSTLASRRPCFRPCYLGSPTTFITLPHPLTCRRGPRFYFTCRTFLVALSALLVCCFLCLCLARTPRRSTQPVQSSSSQPASQLAAFGHATHFLVTFYDHCHTYIALPAHSTITRAPPPRRYPASTEPHPSIASRFSLYSTSLSLSNAVYLRLLSHLLCLSHHDLISHSRPAGAPFHQLAHSLPYTPPSRRRHGSRRARTPFHHPSLLLAAFGALSLPWNPR